MRNFFGHGLLSVLCALSLVALAAICRADADKSLLVEARRAIERGNAEYIAACAARDAAAFAAVYAPNGARLEQGGQIVVGRTAIEKNTATVWAKLTGPLTVKATTADVWLIDDLAYESGAYVISAESTGGTTRISGHYLTIWSKQSDGRWRIYRDLNVVQDAPAP